ncbi:hypothetical protein, partial [Burkholderia cenocepacia]|uniref:hypothetical protein n=1 Tax=Burkholderia cenocepacia TaxID=95486 RepID=UPI00406CE6D0
DQVVPPYVHLAQQLALPLTVDREIPHLARFARHVEQHGDFAREQRVARPRLLEFTPRPLTRHFDAAAAHDPDRAGAPPIPLLLQVSPHPLLLGLSLPPLLADDTHVLDAHQHMASLIMRPMLPLPLVAPRLNVQTARPLLALPLAT